MDNRFNYFIILGLLFLSVNRIYAGELSQKLFLNTNLVNLKKSSNSDDSYHQANNLNMTLLGSPQNIEPGQKSKGKAFILSLLIPGLGQHYVNGRTFTSQAFMGTEILLWSTMAGFQTYGGWRENDYKTFAATHARANIIDKNHTYFVNVGNYSNLDTYNAAKLRERNLPDYYGDVEKYFWNWDSNTNRERFEEMRISADRAYDRVKFTAAAIFVNHVVSAILAMWSAHQYNKKIEHASLNYNLRFSGPPENPTIQLSLIKTFR